MDCPPTTLAKVKAAAVYSSTSSGRSETSADAENPSNRMMAVSAQTREESALVRGLAPASKDECLNDATTAEAVTTTKTKKKKRTTKTKTILLLIKLEQMQIDVVDSLATGQKQKSTSWCDGAVGNSQYMTNTLCFRDSFSQRPQDTQGQSRPPEPSLAC